jgi:hypothetical protein
MKHLILISFFVVFQFRSFGQSISVTQGWTHSVATNTLTEAGNNYTGNVTSSDPQAYVSFTGFASFSNYTVRVHRADIDWNSALVLQVRRRGNGTGGSGGSINGSTSNITLTTSPQVFYNGSVGLSSGRSNVPVRYRVTGRTVLIPAKTYTTNIVYTISN